MNKPFFLLVGIVCLIAPFKGIAGSTQNASIYGKDDRQEILEVQDSRIADLSHSVAMITSLDFIAPIGDSGRYKPKYINPDVPPASRGKADRRRFNNQAMGGYCSSFLIDATHLVTAGHCIEKTDSCENLRFVFDYAVTSNELYNTEQAVRPIIEQDQVKTCKNITQRSLQQGDYAVIELNEAQTNRTYFNLSRSLQAPEVGTHVSMLGYPNGKPLKFTANAQVIATFGSSDFTTIQPWQFVTNLDSFEGNSGSPIFNSETLEVVGILVDGPQDIKTAEDKSISDAMYPEIPTLDQINKVTGFLGERATAISSILEELSPVALNR